MGFRAAIEQAPYRLVLGAVASSRERRGRREAATAPRLLPPAPPLHPPRVVSTGNSESPRPSAVAPPAADRVEVLRGGAVQQVHPPLVGGGDGGVPVQQHLARLRPPPQPPADPTPPPTRQPSATCPPPPPHPNSFQSSFSRLPCLPEPDLSSVQHPAPPFPRPFLLHESDGPPPPCGRPGPPGGSACCPSDWACGAAHARSHTHSPVPRLAARSRRGRERGWRRGCSVDGWGRQAGIVRRGKRGGAAADSEVRWAAPSHPDRCRSLPPVPKLACRPLFDDRRASRSGRSGGRRRRPRGADPKLPAVERSEGRTESRRRRTPEPSLAGPFKLAGGGGQLRLYSKVRCSLKTLENV